MKKIIVLFSIALLFADNAGSQGCIVVRNISGFGQYNFTDNAFSTTDWQFDITTRYFKTFRDFVNTKDVNTPEKDVVHMHSYTTNFTITRLMKNGWSMSISFPISSNTRSATAEHGGLGTPRHTTHSFGIGDTRFTVFKWLVKPRVQQQVNVQIGLGIKFPTGDYKYQDYFYRKEDSVVLAPVSFAIQLGDGGTGIITELNTFYVFSGRRTSLYGNFYYLINPREQNGVLNTFGRTPTTLQIKTGGYITSVPDQYSIRVGANFIFNKFILSAGLRDEGIPVYDLIGGSNGARRSGHNISVEPGILYKIKKTTLYAYIPVIIARKLKQTVPDKKMTEITGTYTLSHGQSPNYLAFVGVSFKL
jgi:hypothetical protein